MWFQNRRAWQLSRGWLTAQGQNSMDTHGLDRACGGPGVKEHEGAQDGLLLLAAVGAVGMDTWRSSRLLTLGTESQLPQVAQPTGSGEEQDPTQASNTDPVELLLDKVLAEIQGENNGPAPMDQDGGPGGRELEGAQESLLPLAEAGCVGMDAWKLTDSLSFCRETQASQVAQPTGPGQAQATIQASKTEPLKLFLDQLPKIVPVEEQAPGPLHLEDKWEKVDTLLELSLTQEEYQPLLEML